MRGGVGSARLEIDGCAGAFFFLSFFRVLFVHGSAPAISPFHVRRRLRVLTDGRVVRFSPVAYATLAEIVADEPRDADGGDGRNSWRDSFLSDIAPRRYVTRERDRAERYGRLRGQFIFFFSLAANA